MRRALTFAVRSPTAQGVARAEEVVPSRSMIAAPGDAASGLVGAVALSLCAGLLLAIRLDRPAFFDNEGRYADVAREMLRLGDWVTPHLDFSVFLNKPPLLYWLAAGIFHVFGPTEWARV